MPACVPVLARKWVWLCMIVCVYVCVCLRGRFGKGTVLVPLTDTAAGRKDGKATRTSKSRRELGIALRVGYIGQQRMNDESTFQPPKTRKKNRQGPGTLILFHPAEMVPKLRPLPSAAVETTVSCSLSAPSEPQSVPTACLVFFGLSFPPATPPPPLLIPARPFHRSPLAHLRTCLARPARPPPPAVAQSVGPSVTHSVTQSSRASQVTHSHCTPPSSPTPLLWALWLKELDTNERRGGGCVELGKGKEKSKSKKKNWR
ncbi:hypothetical protein IF2G_09908 [Cordyceps javanica]|nr:hypothetical protein IF2G_09908 [Cordyceps javanica]